MMFDETKSIVFSFGGGSHYNVFDKTIVVDLSEIYESIKDYCEQVSDDILVDAICNAVVHEVLHAVLHKYSDEFLRIIYDFEVAAVDAHELLVEALTNFSLKHDVRAYYDTLVEAKAQLEEMLKDSEDEEYEYLKEKLELANYVYKYTEKLYSFLSN
ncbi:MAG: hypothetical protein NDF55_10625 [archaeon GB-1867-005]|nr:hypothetical protein [Candidatus Culexmicrobium cathedralense]